MASERSYIAFISYRHKPLDKQAAEMIQRRIERYTVPKEYRDKVGGKNLGVVFRDEDELPASASLSNSITDALDHTKYLLVICTPDLPQSKWCEQEIRYFLKTHDRDHVLAVLVDGKPEQSFSPYLLHTFDEEGNITGDTEPLAANIAGPNHTISKKAFNKEMVRIFSALIGCPFDSLWQRNRRAKTNRLIAVLGVIMAFMAVFMGVILNKNARITEQNVQITEQNTQILEQNEKINEQNDDLQSQMSSVMVEAGRTQLENFNLKGAVTNGLNALLGDPTNKLSDPRAQKLLSDSLGAYQTDEFKSALLYEQTTDITNMVLTDDGSAAILVDQAGTVRAVDSKTGSLVWEVSDPNAAGDSLDDSPMDLFPVKNFVICKYGSAVIARSLADGSEIWRYDYSIMGSNHFRAISQDGTRLLILDYTNDTDKILSLFILDTATGDILGHAPVASEGEEDSFASFSPWYNFAGGFSPSGQYAAIALYLETDSEDAAEDSLYNKTEFLKMIVFDTADMSELYCIRTKETGLSTNLLLGLTVMDNGNLILPRYCSSFGGIVCSLTNSADATGEQILTNHTLKDKTGMVFEIVESVNVVPMLASDYYALVACENMLYVYDFTDGLSQLKSYGFTGNILSARWIDRDEEIAELLTDDGCIARYDFSRDGEGLLDVYSAWTYDQTSINRLCPHYGDDGEILFCLTVPTVNHGRILRVEARRDPSGEYFPETPDFGSHNLRAFLSPSGDRIFVFYSKDTLTVVTYDAATFAEISRTEYEDADSSRIGVIDDTHFICGTRLYSLDGSSEYLEKITDENSSKFWDYSMNTIRMYDGRTLTAAHISSSFSLVTDPCWIDGKLVEASNDPKIGLCFGSSSYFDAGRNGLIVGHGTCAYNDENDEFVQNDTDTFNVFDALNEKRSVLEDLHPDTTKRLIALGTETPVFICADDSGTLCLYNAENETGTDLAFTYSPGEILQIAFAPGDRYLIVLTRSSRLDCLDLESGEAVYSGTPDILNKSSSRYISSASVEAGSESGYLYIIFRSSSSTNGCLIELDPSSGTVLAEADDIYEALTDADCLIALRQRDLIHYPIYSITDLSDWAEDYLSR